MCGSVKLSDNDSRDDVKLNRHSLPSVLVMMATYNGDKYIREQIESILYQEDVAVTLWVKDDCSTDNTFEILTEYSQVKSNVFVDRNDSQLGAGQNFMQMVYDSSSTGFDYYAFADQDDIWCPRKLVSGVCALSSTPELLNTPALYYSDFVNFQGENDIIGRELIRFSKMEDVRGSLLVKNWVNGFVMVCNKELFDMLRLYQPPEFPRLHDAWVHLIARYCGVVVPDYDSVNTFRRISGSNAVGITQGDYKSAGEAKDSFMRLFTPPTNSIEKTAAFLLEGYGDYMKKSDREMVAKIASYRSSLRSRLDVAFDRNYFMPTREMTFRNSLKFLLGRY